MRSRAQRLLKVLRKVINMGHCCSLEPKQPSVSRLASGQFSERSSKQTTEKFSERSSKPRRKNISENKCRSIIESIYHVPFPSCRPDFLKNPETKRNLELDMYNEQLKLAFEYQGKQHYQKVTYFQDTVDFKKQLQRDSFKKKRCQELGIKLICIPYTMIITRENILSLIH